ncbi:hypothetical protein [Agromyces sp. CCNWLW203]|uniref:hypothetical protein n=1 Tax=Agromyces sp. CCNWLW203 TaxID=3112842 RepID=UPI002F961349
MNAPRQRNSVRQGWPVAAYNRMVARTPTLAMVPPRTHPAISPYISRIGILTAGIVAQGAAQLAAFFVAYFGAIPSLVNAVIHPYEEAATPDAIFWAVVWCVLLLFFIALVAVMNRYARYMHQWWLGEVATRVIESYEVPLHLVAKATRYKPIATPFWPAPNRVLRLHDKSGWFSGEATIEILVPAKAGRPIIVAMRDRSTPASAASVAPVGQPNNE